MKKLLLVFVLVLTPLAFDAGCVAPSARQQQIATLQTTGQLAEAAVTISAELYRDGGITAAQAREVMRFYDLQFQPVFRMEVARARANLATAPSPELAGLLQQLTDFVSSLQTPSP